MARNRIFALLLLTPALLILSSGRALAKPLDVSLDDRVDPVPIGSDLVYEIDVQVNGANVAPGVVATLHLPAGTTFLSARRQPGFGLIPAQVNGNDVVFDLGDEPPCGKKDLPACADIWALVRVTPAVDPGTVLAASVDLTSSDPVAFKPDSHTAYTSAGTLAIRRGRVNFSAVPGRDRVQLEADIGRNGWATPNDPPPANFDLSNGVRVIVGETGEAPVLDITVPGDAFKCRGNASVRCRLANPRDWRPLGLDRLNVLLRHDFSQRNNANILVRTFKLTLPPDFGPDLELVVEADGESYEDTALHVEKGRRQVYTHTQRAP